MKQPILHNSYVNYATWLDQIEQLEDNGQFELVYKYMRAIWDYGIYGEYDDSDVMVKLLMTQTALSIDKAQDRYAAAVENGKKGGRPRKNKDEEIFTLREKGLTNKEIAEELKCSVSTIERANKRNRSLDTATVQTPAKSFDGFDGSGCEPAKSFDGFDGSFDGFDGFDGSFDQNKQKKQLLPGDGQTPQNQQNLNININKNVNTNKNNNDKIGGSCAASLIDKKEAAIGRLREGIDALIALEAPTVDLDQVYELRKKGNSTASISYYLDCSLEEALAAIRLMSEIEQMKTVTAEELHISKDEVNELLDTPQDDTAAALQQIEAAAAEEIEDAPLNEAEAARQKKWECIDFSTGWYQNQKPFYTICSTYYFCFQFPLEKSL